MTGRRWRVELAEGAVADIRGIFDWTVDRFGRAQASAYAEMIDTTLRSLQSGPEQPGVKRRPDLGGDLYVIRVSGGKRRGRHLMVFHCRADDGSGAVSVLRVLHEAMDLRRHVP